MAATWHETRGNAREPDGGMPGRDEAESAQAASKTAVFKQIPLPAASPIA
ncbi:MAG: hypothetical protein Q8S75_05845 [Nitrospirota bacterium]|nr:hypothetical protein [Nitrospirota bacterium]